MEMLNNHCRFCFSTYGIIELDVFKQYEESNSSIAEDLFKLCNITLQNTEALPTKICGICSLSVTNLKDFLTNLNKSQKRFLEFLNNRTKKYELKFLEDISNSNHESESKNDEINNSFYENEKLVPNVLEPNYFYFFESMEQSDDCTQNIELETDCEVLNDAPSIFKGNNDYNKTNTSTECELCGQIYLTQKDLSAHKKNEHISSEIRISFNKQNENDSRTRVKLYECNICDRNFASAAALTMHRRKHSVFYADYADADYDSQDSKDNEYLCPHCDKKFRSKSQRFSHIYTVHEKNLRVICDECGKEFKTKSRLMYHMVVHSEEEKYKCNFCGRNFKRKKNLCSHIETHVGLKAFQCCSCNMSFVQHSCYRNHLKNKHREKFDEMIAKGERISTSNALSLDQLQAINEAVKNGENYKDLLKT